MGMYGNWLRVNPAELEQAKRDQVWAQGLASAAEASGSDRWTSIDQMWEPLNVLLSRHVSVPLVHGDAMFVDHTDEASMNAPGADWGHGPAMYLTPEQVAIAHKELSGLSAADLIEGLTEAELDELDDWAELLDDVTPLFPDIQAFITAAARCGDGMICWIS